MKDHRHNKTVRFSIALLFLVLFVMMAFTARANQLEQIVNTSKYDLNGDGVISITDVTVLLDYLAHASSGQEEYVKPTFVVSNVNAQAGGSGIQVPVLVKKNPGVSSIAFDVAYGNGLTLTSVQFNSSVFQGNVVTSQTLTSPAFVSWVGMSDVEDDAVFVTLIFDVDSGASGVIDISITYDEDNVFDQNEDNVSFEIENGSVTVS